MKVQMTSFLREELSRLGTDPDAFIESFSDWKSRGPAGEFDHYYFGKDSEYLRPLVDGKRVLRHVHLVPSANLADLAEWDRDWRRYRRRKSDTALVYANGGRHGFLLIAILWEPNGHALADMKTQESIELMNDFASVAVHLQFNGSVLI